MFSSDARWSDGPRGHDHPSRDRRDDSPTLGRGGGSSSRDDQSNDNDQARGGHRHLGVRTRDRDHGDRERSVDPRDVFMRDVDLPRGRERQVVRDREQTYKLRGSETRTLATVGAFRVVPARDLRDDMAALPTRGQVTFGTFEKKGSSRPYVSTAIVTWPSC